MSREDYLLNEINKHNSNIREVYSRDNTGNNINPYVYESNYDPNYTFNNNNSNFHYSNFNKNNNIKKFYLNLNSAELLDLKREFK